MHQYLKYQSLVSIVVGMDLGLADRVVLVTGASGAIGAATARAVAAEGGRVGLGYHSGREAAELLATELQAAGGEAIAVPLDLCEPDTAAAAVQTLAGAWGGVDALVASAVVWPAWPPHGGGPFAPTPAGVLRQQLAANVEGTASTVQAALPHMRARGWGRIVLISSALAEDGRPGMEAYAAAKAALHGLSRSLAWGLGPDGILINVVVPGLVPTPRNRQTMPPVLDQVARLTPTGRLATEDEVARVAVFLVSAANGCITGTTVRVSGGL
jgi:3-oxoacyl-[acyl-carrier protein] reductase